MKNVCCCCLCGLCDSAFHCVAPIRNDGANLVTFFRFVQCTFIKLHMLKRTNHFQINLLSSVYAKPGTFI